MEKKNSAGALIATLSLPLMLATFSVPVANAASVSSTVATVDNCKWVMANVPTEIAMSTSATYNGDTLNVSTVIESPTLGLSGTTSTVGDQASSTECSFYNLVIDAEVTAELSGTFFEAYYGDIEGVPLTKDVTMDFDIDPNAPLSMTFDVQECESATLGWTGSSAEFDSAEMISLFQFESLADEYAAGSGPICHPETTVELTIPDRSTVPAGAGQRYFWDGPTIIFAKSPTD